MIKLTNINKVFQQGHREIQALSDINLHVPQGQIYGVIGASGAGKSTLIRCVNMLERPTSGQVLVGGRDLTKMNDKELTRARRGIGMIFQHFNLLSSRTVFGNIALPLELDPGPLAAGVPEAGWTPLRISLALAWAAAGVALLAVGLPWP